MTADFVRCARPGCAVGVQPGQSHCLRCRTWGRLGRGFFLVRLSLLLTVLVLIGLWGYGDVQSRNSRTHWDRTLSVAVVLVTTAPVDPAAIQKLEVRLADLEELLAREFSRYREGPRPFRLVLHGTAQASSPPELPESAWQLPRHLLRQWSYLSAIDDQIGLESERYDSRVYVVARPPATNSVQFVEGYSQQGGRVGIVEVELNVEMVDLVLSVTAHELLHTLGAEDKYDAEGHTLIPEGLAEPDRSPPLPQRYVEVMARNRPVSETRERILERLEELRVGPLTASEIGWVPRTTR
ncbi:MAG TPA: hypothetical protein VI197_01520 [Polyangiaceae bacterium]